MYSWLYVDLKGQRSPLTLCIVFFRNLQTKLVLGYDSHLSEDHSTIYSYFSSTDPRPNEESHEFFYKVIDFSKKFHNFSLNLE